MVGLVRPVHAISVLTESVLTENSRRPDLLALTAIVSDNERSLSTTARSFVSCGSKTCTYLLVNRAPLKKWYRRTSGSGHIGSDNLWTS